MEEALYSTSKPHWLNVTGGAKQVYDMDDFLKSAIKTIRAGNVTAISSTSVSAYFLHVHTPKIYEDIQGDPAEIIGNASND